jgi:hypothetical protein
MTSNDRRLDHDELQRLAIIHGINASQPRVKIKKKLEEEDALDGV